MWSERLEYHFRGNRLGVLSIFALALGGKPQDTLPARSVNLPRSVLLDKIKGGWAGQAIGCTYGGPTEFLYQGTIIHDYQPIPWSGLTPLYVR